MHERLLIEMKDKGITRIENLYSDSTLLKWNNILDREFADAQDGNRNYVKMDKLYELNLLEEIFNAKMRNLILNLMPDPLLLACHVYETSPSDKPHVFGDSFDGWHRDVNELPGMNARDLNYISIFIHLSNVEEDSGAFETVLSSFTTPLQNNLESIKVLGDVGTTYIWNRTMLHRANPNRSNSKRRMLKLSIQHNHLQNEHVNSEMFKNILAKYSNSEDVFMRYILGSEHHKSPAAPIPFDTIDIPTTYFMPVQSNSKVLIGLIALIKGFLYYVRKGKKMFGP